MNAKELKEELEYKNRSAFESISEDELERSFAYAESYKLFLDNCKTERGSGEVLGRDGEEKRLHRIPSRR